VAIKPGAIKPNQTGGLWLSRGVQGAVAILAIAGVITMQRSQLQQVTLGRETPQQAEQREGVRLGVLKRLPNLGFNNMVANWAFLNYLQYYGDDAARQQTGYGLLPQYFDVITQRDPRFVDTYLFLAGSLSYQSGQPQLTAEYIKRGTDALSPQMHPRAFLLWRFLGLDQILLTGDIPGAIASHQKAAEWAAGSEDPEIRQVAEVFRLTAQFLTTDPDSRPVRLQAWSSIFAQAEATQDVKTQARARAAILSLGGIEQVDAEGRTFFTLPDPPPVKGGQAPETSPEKSRETSPEKSPEKPAEKPPEKKP
jgi:hypothetical protein